MNWDYPNYEDIVALHDVLISSSGGSYGIRDHHLLMSAVVQPQIGGFGQEFYPSIEDKASILCYSLVQDHAFVDGNKRIGQAAMELFLLRNGYEINASINEQEAVILSVASSTTSRQKLAEWIKNHIVPA